MIPFYPHSVTVVCKFSMRGVVSDYYDEIYQDSEKKIPDDERTFAQVSLRRSLTDDHEEPAEYITINVKRGRS